MKDFKDETLGEVVRFRLFPVIKDKLEEIRVANPGKWENQSHQIRCALNEHIQRLKE